MFFKKKEYKELMLPYVLDISAGDETEVYEINIECYCIDFDKPLYCYAAFYYHDKTQNEESNYHEVVNLLKSRQGEKIKIKFQVVGGQPKNFTIDLDYLCETFGNPNLRNIDLLGTGLNDKSYKELM